MLNPVKTNSTFPITILNYRKRSVILLLHVDATLFVLEIEMEKIVNLEIPNVCEELFEACTSGNTKIMELLLNDSSIELNARTNNGWTAFMFACFKGHTEVVKLFFDHSKRRKIDVNACNNGHTDVVKLFLYHSEIRLNLPLSSHTFTLIKSILLENFFLNSVRSVEFYP